MFFHLMIGFCIPVTIDNVSNQQKYEFQILLLENCNDMIESGIFFPLIPNTDFVDDIPPLGIAMMS